MTIAIASIQRNRAPWLMEWLAFHLVVGFDRFYIYTHKCTDNSTELLARLSRHYPIVIHPFEGEQLPQLVAYQHACNTYLAEEDWIAFIDGDEFLFPVNDSTIGEALARFADKPLSALAAYWMCYGSSGHLSDPDGLIIENFTRHSGIDFLPNRHVKSIVRGRGQLPTVTASHVFTTEAGTFDERLRPINHGWMKELEPSYDFFRINHYSVQSWDFYAKTKCSIGAPDGNPKLVRPPEWFRLYDRNEHDDGMRWRFLLDVKLKLREMHAHLATT